MGACVSRPENCVGGKFGGSRKKRNRKRRQALKRRFPSHLSDRSSDRAEKLSSLPVDRPFSIPLFMAFVLHCCLPIPTSMLAGSLCIFVGIDVIFICTWNGSVEEAWFDSAAVLESDWSDEDFQSLPDGIHRNLSFSSNYFRFPVHIVELIMLALDVLSVSGFDGTSMPRNVSATDTSHTDGGCRIRPVPDPMDSSTGNSEPILGSEKARSSVTQSVSDVRVKADGPLGDVQPVFLDEISGPSGETPGGDDSLLDNCGLLPNNCLPCLASTIPHVEKRRSLSSSPKYKEKGCPETFIQMEGRTSYCHFIFFQGAAAKTYSRFPSAVLPLGEENAR
ncbi:UNVERIFIED_CONTAM: hypothetical protein Sradi_4837300 [Sesamum radiatum]|uniref:Uncharacterized protein n=1 Tax=Sesamum radiatum TaxID=300843 RepID=A0AAW2MXM3_SESRA